MTAPTAPTYDATQVVTGASALYIAPANTPLPADSSILWDPTNWTGKTLTLNGATAATFSVTTSAGTQTTASQTTFTKAALTTALAGLSNVGAGNVTITGTDTTGPFVVVFANTLGAVTLAVTANTGGPPTVTGGLWVPPGATEAGWTFTGDRATQPITIEEQSTPVNEFVSTSNAMISGNAAQASTTNLQYALNAVKSVIARVPGTQPSVEVLTMSDTLVHYAAALETLNVAGFARRYYIPDTIVPQNLTQTFRRQAQQHLVPLQFRAVCPPGSIVVRNITSIT